LDIDLMILLVGFEFFYGFLGVSGVAVEASSVLVAVALTGLHMTS
jgi:hypothetical protein